MLNFNIEKRYFLFFLIRKYGNYHLPFNKMSWSDYREVYKKAFGKYPEVNVIWRSNKELEG